MSEAVPARRAPSPNELRLVHALRNEAEEEFSAQFEQERFLDWSRLARRATWRSNLALQIEIHGAGRTLGWIGVHATDSDDADFWQETIARVRAAVIV